VRNLAVSLTMLYFGPLAFAIMQSDDLPAMERDAGAIELYLQDKQDHENYCPELPWKQPKLEKYKEELSSYLPENCK